VVRGPGEEEGGEENESEIKKMFREMKSYIYYPAVLSLYAVEILGSVIIKDVAPIFEFVAAFAVSAISFTLPGIFFLLALKNFGTEEQKKENKWNRIGAISYIVMGILCTITLLVNAIINVAMEE
jgi:amino acid permease